MSKIPDADGCVERPGGQHGNGWLDRQRSDGAADRAEAVGGSDPPTGNTRTLPSSLPVTNCLPIRRELDRANRVLVTLKLLSAPGASKASDVRSAE